MTTPPAPPRPPIGSQIKYDKEGNLVVGQLWQKWTAPAGQCTVETIRNPNKTVSVVVSTPAGATRRHRVKPAFADRTMSWAVAFNAWREGAGQARM